jgi:hypothetical protein
LEDKIIFYLDNDLRQYCLSYYLQKKINAEFFMVSDITNKPKNFFKEQNFVNFKEKWFLHDYTLPGGKIDMKYLKEFEEKYEIDLWNLAINERLFYRFNDFYKFSRLEILSILEKECKLFENILDSTKPDFAVLHEPFFHSDELFYRICKAKGIKILMSYLSNYGYKYEISQNDHIMDNINEFDNVKIQGRSFQELEKIFNQNDITNFIKNLNEHGFGSKKNMFKAGVDFGIKSKNNNLKTHYTYFGRTKSKVLANKLESSIKTNNRKKFIDKKLTKSVDYNLKYVYFPLHIDQERTTLIETPFYTNQIEFIRNIVKSLPIDHVLYAKEHPTQSMRHWRSKEWYEEVMEIPNLTLIHPDISSQKLIENCSLLITISGTAALEAAFLQKPSITFIDSDYTKIDSIERVKSIEELPKMIRKSIKKKITSEDLDRYVSLKENYAFDYNDEDFQQSSLNKFYHGGQLVDVYIMNEDMKEFLEESEKKLNEFTDQHIKKMEYLKKL